MSEWDESAAGWDDAPPVRAYAEAAFQSLEPVLAQAGLVLTGAKVLDFGCGTGLLTERLVEGGAAVTAVDTSTAMLDVLRAKIEAHGWTTVSVSTEMPGTADHDLIVCSSVCSFLDDYPGTVRALADLLSPRGLFVQWDWELDYSDDDPHGLTRSAVAEALAAANLEDTWVGTAFEVAHDGMTMSPLMGRGRKPA